MVLSKVVKILDVDPAVTEMCDALRLKHSDIKWALFKINDNSVIVVDSTLVCNTFDEDFQNDKDQFLALKEKLESNEPRYIIYKFSLPDIGQRLAFIYW